MTGATRKEALCLVEKQLDNMGWYRREVASGMGDTMRLAIWEAILAALAALLAGEQRDSEALERVRGYCEVWVGIWADRDHEAGRKCALTEILAIIEEAEAE